MTLNQFHITLPQGLTNEIGIQSTRSMSDQSLTQYNTNPICRAWATTGDLMTSTSEGYTSKYGNIYN